MIKKINLDELRVGMFVCGMEKVADKPLFFMNNILLRSQGEVEKMAQSGYYCVYINVEDEPAAPKDQPTPALADPAAGPWPLTEPVTALEPVPLIEISAPIAPEAPAAAVMQSPPDELVEEASLVEQLIPEEIFEEAALTEAVEAGPKDAEHLAETGFDEELKEARKIRNEAEVLVREFLHTIRLGKEIDTGKVGGTVGHMVDSVFRNADALVSLARLKSFDDYTFAHCVNVSILSIAIGRQMGLERASLEELGTGAILHDIGKMLVPQSVLNKPGKLTDEEFSAIKRHSELGGEVLLSAKITEGSRLVATQHHERYDGSGYHRGLSRDGIHVFARIAAVADVYDAMTSNRVYQKGMVPEDALKRLYLMRGSHFEPELVERLIRCLGIYPIGTFVELNTGELAVVRMVNRSHPMQPQIRILTDRSKKPCESPQDTDLKDEIGRWIVATRRAEEFPPLQEALAS